jgi:hypothetical protein
LDTLLKNPEFGGVLEKGMDHVFPLRSTSASQDILKNKKVVPELSGTNFADLFNAISCSLNICIGTVYEILEGKLLVLVGTDSFHSIFTENGKHFLERTVAEKWHEDRLKYLSVRARVIQLVNDQGGSRHHQTVNKWVRKACNEGGFFEKLVNDLKVLVDLKAARFNENEEFIRVVTKVKEQEFLILSIYHLIRKGLGQGPGNSELLRLMLQTKFLGVFGETFKERRPNLGVHQMEKTQNTVRILFESILLETLFQSLDERDLKKSEVKRVSKKLFEIDGILMEHARLMSKEGVVEE